MNPLRVLQRADGVAGAAFIALGILVFAISGDLPFGRLSAPGAGMMPKLMAGLMILFAVVLIVGSGSSRELPTIDWSDRSHAALVVLAYRCRDHALSAARLSDHHVVAGVLAPGPGRAPQRVARRGVYGICLSVFAYWLFGIALKSPLERGLLWF